MTVFVSNLKNEKSNAIDIINVVNASCIRLAHKVMLIVSSNQKK